MGKFESSKGAQGREQGAEQIGYASIPVPLLRAAGDTSARSTGISVTAGAIGMGLASQSASQDGLMAFAATLPGADVLASLAKAETQRHRASSADVAGAEGIGVGFQPDGADPLPPEATETTSYDMAVTPAVQESQLASYIAIYPSAVVGTTVQGARSASVNSSAGTHPNADAGGDAQVVSVIEIVPSDDFLPDDIMGNDGPVESIVRSVIGDGSIVDGLLGGVLGEGGLLDSVLGEDGVVGVVFGEDGIVSGLLGNGGVINSVLGDGDLVDGLVGGVLGDDGLVGGLLGEDGVVDNLLGDDGLVGGLLGADGLVGGLLGDDGVVDMVQGDDGLVGGALGEEGLVGGLHGDGGLLDGLLGGGGSEAAEIVPVDLVDTTITEVSGVLEAGAETITQVAGGVLGDDGLAGGALGDDGLVDGLLGGLLGGGAVEVEEVVPTELTDTDITEVSYVLETGTETVTQFADGVLGDGALVDGALGDEGLAGGLLAEGGAADELLGGDGLVGGALGGDGLVDGLLGGDAAEAEEVVPTELIETAVPEGVDVLEDGAEAAVPAIKATLDAGSVVNEVPIVGGILAGQAASVAVLPLTEGPVAGLSEGVTAEPNDAQTLIGQAETDSVAPTDTPDTSEADVSGAALLDDVPVTEDAGDDGFLDTLVAGDTEDLLGSVETLLDPSDALLDGLLGEVDVFGLNVVEGDEGDDLFAGLTGEQGLTGSLVKQDVLGLSDPIGDDAPDAEVDNLLNDILAGGVSDITGEEGAFDALFGIDVMAEEEGELLGVGDTAAAEAGAVEGALDILFDNRADQGHSLLGGLLQETFDNDNA